MKIVILAAGIGSRLGHPFPKPLTVLKTGKSIMCSQIDSLTAVFPMVQIIIVVGFKKEMIMESFPEALFVYNNEFDRTNTSKSLLKALCKFDDEGILWLNGDVVFDTRILNTIKPHVENEKSFVCVNKSRVADEEVKYTLGENGYIAQLSKQVERGLGEAVGINYISKDDVKTFIQRLMECDPNDYFERGIELAIEKDGLAISAVDISNYNCIEVDFQEDLVKANELL